MVKLEIDLNKMTEKQWQKLDKALRKHIPFKAINWISDE